VASSFYIFGVIVIPTKIRNGMASKPREPKNDKACQYEGDTMVLMLLLRIICDLSLSNRRILASPKTRMTRTSDWEATDIPSEKSRQDDRECNTSIDPSRPLTLCPSDLTTSQADVRNYH
jgi:hypothetical protein